MKNPIPYGKQHITDNDIQSVIKVLHSDFLTQGPLVPEFEKKFAEYISSEYAIAVSNGTTALHLANIVLNIQPGDKIITTPITFAASANASLYCGAVPDFVDIDPKTFLLDLNHLENKLRQFKKGTYKLIIPVDFAGYPINTEELNILAKKFEFSVLEDACHAPGAYFINSSGEKVFSGMNRYTDLTVFSFHPVKHIATGEGGMITTNNSIFCERLRRLRTHGITKDPDLLEENHGDWYYEMQELGYNYRMTDIQAALGNSQLSRAENNLLLRRKIAEKYNQAFSDHPKIVTPAVNDNIYHAYHLYVILTDNRDKLFMYLRKNNIMVQVHYIPLHLQPYYRTNFGFKKGDFPIAENYYQKAISLPMYPSLSEEQQSYVIDKILEFYKTN